MTKNAICRESLSPFDLNTFPPKLENFFEYPYESKVGSFILPYIFDKYYSDRKCFVPAKLSAVGQTLPPCNFREIKSAFSVLLTSL